jgi:signal transduction histidine kinase
MMSFPYLADKNLPMIDSFLENKLSEISEDVVQTELRNVYLKGDKIMMSFIGGHFILALLLAFFYDTWLLTIGISVAAALMFYLSAFLLPGSFITRCIAGVSLQTFTALHIYQLHGMPEMHFFFFTAFTMMIIYQDWVSMWPGTILIIGQHIAFAALQNMGVNMYFFPDNYIELTKLIFHFGIAILHVGICGYWAHRLKKQTIFETSAKQKLKDLLYETQNQHEEIQQTAEELYANNEVLAQTNDLLDLSLKKEQQAKEELSQHIKELKKTQSQLVHAEKMSSLGQLTAGVAHEINNPINFVSVGINALEKNLNYLYQVVDQYDQIKSKDDFEITEQRIMTLKEKVEYADLKESLFSLVKSIQIGAGRTADIVKGLRNFSRLDNDEKILANIHHGLDSTLLILHNKTTDRIEIIKQYDPSLPLIECNLGQLNQVFMNLLVNAIQAIEGPGTILVSTKDVDKFVEIKIKDSGSGMSEEVRSKIFEPFFTTKAIGKGTGLGLSISYGIIEKHNGTIAVESEPGKGTAFKIILPKRLIL